MDELYKVTTAYEWESQTLVHKQLFSRRMSDRHVHQGKLGTIKYGMNPCNRNPIRPRK